MPGMDGAELARRLRVDFSREDLVLVAVTGLERHREDVAEGPFDHHLLKPVALSSV